MQKKEVMLILINVTIVLMAILVSAVSWTGNNVAYNATEDIVYNHNLSANITDPELNMIFSIDEVEIIRWNGIQINYSNISSWIFISNETTGNLVINASYDNQTGNFTIPLRVNHSQGADIRYFNFSVSAVNDAPQFVILPNNVTEEQTLNFTISATDEENNIPFYFNFSVISCNKTYAEDEGCNVFNLTSINSTSASFTFNSSVYNSTATNDEVGNYTINFSVYDAGNTIQPYNASVSQTVNFTVINVNNAPYFTYSCGNELNTTENTLFSCWVNATDVDESYNLTFFSNYSWLKFNNSQSNMTINMSGNSAKALINFTPVDAEVANWTINMTAIDSGDGNATAIKSNYTFMHLFVNNTQDNVFLSTIQNQTAITNIQFTLYINASDDDLLITSAGKQIYNESLTFSDNLSLFNINITKYSESYNGSSNISIALIQFTPNSSHVGNHSINISVVDNSSNMASQIFILSVENNTLPEWNESTPINQNLTEDILDDNLNLSEWVTDLDNDTMIFYSNNSATEFPSFNLNQTTGILSFTPNDSDVGLHYIKINASDGKGNSSKIFSFNVSNVYDNPLITQIGNITTQEEYATIIYIYTYDDDLFIQNKSVYDENLTFAKSITNLTGIYRDLFNNITIVNVSGNLTKALINFTPVKADRGNYSINITATDIQGLLNYTVFNLIILELNHTPQLSIGNQTAGINNTFTLYINATDADNDSISFSDNATFFDIAWINETHDNDITFATALINFSANDSYVGAHSIKINASDGGNINSTNVIFRIYDGPVIYSLTCSSENPPENSSTTCDGNASQTIAENLTYNWMIDNVIRANNTGLGQKTWNYNTNFTDEGLRNLTLNVSNSFFTTISSLNLNITHVNAPPEFSGQIPNLTITGTSTTLELLDYFSDADHDDLNYNQTINFSWEHYDATNLTEIESPAITTTVSDYTATFTSSATAAEYVRFTATDYNNASYNASSNYFIVNITTPQQTPSSGGGGSRGAESLNISLEIIVPDPFSMDALGKNTTSIIFYNNGNVILNNIKISLKTTRNDVKVELSSYEINSLAVEEKKELELTITANALGVRDVEPLGILIMANVSNTQLSESAMLLVNLLEHDRELRIKAEQKRLFLQELLDRNNECLELSEVLKESDKEFNQYNYNKSLTISENAIQICKSIIESQGKNISILKRLENYKWIMILVIVIIVIILFIIIFLSYYYQKRKYFR